MGLYLIDGEAFRLIERKKKGAVMLIKIVTNG